MFKVRFEETRRIGGMNVEKGKKMVKLYMFHHLSLLLLMILDTLPSFPLKWTIKVMIFHCLTSQMEMRKLDTFPNIRK